MAMTWSWLERWLLPTDPPPAVDAGADARAEQTLEDAAAAKREFDALKRRARAMGIEVDVARSWGPRENRS